MNTLLKIVTSTFVSLFICPFAAQAQQTFSLQIDLPEGASQKAYSVKPTLEQSQAITQVTLANAQFVNVGQSQQDAGCFITTSLSSSGKTLKLILQGEITQQGNVYYLSFSKCHAQLTNLGIQVMNQHKVINGVIRHTPYLGVSSLATPSDTLVLDSDSSMQAFSYALPE